MCGTRLYVGVDVVGMLCYDVHVHGATCLDDVEDGFIAHQDFIAAVLVLPD
jgi:hypothetical protein